MKNEFTPINGQMLCDYAQQRFGLRRLKDNGCAVLAIYNALGLLERDVSICDIIEVLGNSWNGRVFGVFPNEIGRCLTHYGATYQKMNSFEELSEAMQQGGIAIVSRWNRLLGHFSIPNIFKGAHTMAVFCDSSGTCFVYNRYSNCATYKTYPSFADFMVTEQSYITGYYLQKNC